MGFVKPEGLSPAPVNTTPSPCLDVPTLTHFSSCLSVHGQKIQLVSSKCLPKGQGDSGEERKRNQLSATPTEKELCREEG